MRGGLDETLARLARREEALRRRSTDPGGDTDPPASLAAGQHRARAPEPLPVDEVAEAVRRIVQRHPALAVELRVAHDSRAYPLRVAWSEGSVTVSAEPAPPPAWPLSARTVPAWSSRLDGPAADPAARLADLIRRDPSLLSDIDPTR
ncbi:hypothetical protein QTQ03_16315 [Micromonospora sp. WMMA1363]|uniref:hypothetical protein n=1 Tax=Micromonospora sp. WMMA1363 TaxID=3053985 RepID=UPI00259CB5CB|nr:hypothetical protein [Micromonospora sp. WMMA1363]MDM4721085.1 hypothetical protein [Micromonospora sp. WMMA1363]